MTDEQLREAAAMYPTMRAAAKALNMDYQTFRKYVKRLGLWRTNQGGRGLKKPVPVIPLEEILQGLHPEYGRSHLKRRLLTNGLKKNECEECGLSEWRGKPLVIQLEHINGVKNDHRWSNLKMLCPNCHSQTPTFSGRNRNAMVAERQTRYIQGVVSERV